MLTEVETLVLSWVERPSRLASIFEVSIIWEITSLPGAQSYSLSTVHTSLTIELAVPGQACPGQMKPWAMINARMLGDELPAQSLTDMIIVRARTRAAGVPMLPLEKLMEQFASFDFLDTAHLLILRDALATPSTNFQALNRETTDLYAQQRLADLVALQTARVPSAA